MSGWAGGVKRSILTKKRAKSYIYIYIFRRPFIQILHFPFLTRGAWRSADSLRRADPPNQLWRRRHFRSIHRFQFHQFTRIYRLHIYIYISASSCHERVRISGVILTLRLLSSLSWQVPSCPPWSHRASRRRRGGTGDGARRTSSPSGRSKTWPPTRPHCPRPAIVSGKGSSAARRRRWRWWSCGGSVRTT